MARYGSGSVPIAIGWKGTNCHRTHRDPAREFVQRFYDPKNGDVILNPLDKRCPYWGPAEELRRRSEAKALAVSLFQPPQDKKGEFFIESPQKIFAFLMAYGPTPEELVKW